MSLTIAEIGQYQEHFRQEIVQRECVIAALEVLRTHAANGRAPRSIDLGSLVSALVPTIPLAVEAEPVALPAPVSVTLPAAEPVAPPPSAPVKRYINPELEALQRPYSSQTKAVRWAIEKMTGDYSIHDLDSFLEKEGCRVGASSVSVILSRLKRHGEIEEVRRGAGPHPAVYRGPAQADAFETETADTPGNPELNAALAMVS